MNKFKKPLLILLVLALFAACILTFVGCGEDGDNLSGISISTKSAHKKVYVQGQELNLEGGILTTVTDGKEASLPFTADGVTVTGYDPQKLGKQTLTVSYMDKTATFEVEVVARAIADGYEKDYFVEEKFDPLKGKIKITKDNGATVNVSMSSRSVKLKSFDSSTAGTQTVTVTYTDESGVTYDCSFDVTVHNIANVTFTPPYKTEYKSHEDTFDTAGGWLTVTAEAPSTLSKPIQISASMISDFKPSLATSENIDTPLDQIVKITYGGKTFEFPITVYYSGIYLIDDAAEDLKSIDWTAANPIVDDRQATLAIRAMEAYFKLEDSEKNLIEEEKLHTVLRPAIVGLYGKYLNESASFKDAFVISPQGSFELTANTREGVENAIARLNDPKDIFNVYASLAENIRGEFKNFEITEGVTVSKYLITHVPDDVAQLVDLFRYMLNISDYLKDVDSWTVDTLKNYGDDIVMAATSIITSDYANINYAQVYFAVSSWRDNNDYIDIIYSYYYYIKPGGQEEIKTKLWGRIPAPGMLADWYTAFVSAINEEQMLEYYQGNAYLYDVSGFMYYYSQVLDLSKKVLENGDELSKNLYVLLDCDAAINAYLRSAKFGYIYNMGEALDYERVNSVWNKYIALIDNVLSSLDESMVAYGDQIETLTKELLSLSPAELNTFLSSMNFLYETSGGTVKVLDYSSGTYNNMLTYVLALYYEEVLPETVTPLFRYLLLAAESISQIGMKKDALDDYMTYMSGLDGLFEDLSTADQNEFNKYFEEIYKKHEALYKNVLKDSDITFGGRDDDFNELIGWLDTLDEIFILISTTEDADELNRLVPLAIAIYEESSTLYEALRTSGNPDTVNALFTKLYSKNGIDYTLDKRFFGARAAIVNILISSGVSDAAGNSIMSWDAYSGASAETKAFIVKILPLMLAQHEGKLYTGDVYELVTSFRALDKKDQAAFYLLGVNVLYYEAIENNVESKLTEANKVDDLLNKILNLEIAYVMYVNTNSGDALTALRKAASDVEKLVSELSDTQNRDTYLAPLYAEYLEFVNGLK